MNNGTSPSGGRQGRLGNEENRPTGIYGDHMKQKRTGMVRILFQNPQGLGHLSGGNKTLTPKLEKLRDALIKHKIDIVGLAEIKIGEKFHKKTLCGRLLTGGLNTEE
jgi:hypothetical protein